MNECMPVMNTGLRGASVASTKISNVDGAKGKLIYRGYLVADLAEKASFEEIIYLLLYEDLPTRDALAQFKQHLLGKRPIDKSVFEFMKALPPSSSPMDVFQAAIPLLARADARAEEKTIDAALESALNIIAGFPTLVAAWERIRNKKAVVSPRDDLDHGANFLYMLKGEMPHPEIMHFFDTALVLHAEHSFNASTFTARQVASTRAHMYASLSAAMGSLSGELHGGANVRVMEMLKAIGTSDAIDPYIENTLASGGKIMGLGHAVYQVDDPRADILAPMSRRLGEIIGDTRWYELSKELEIKAKKAFKTHKNMDIFVNVDFYSASLFYTMGIPTDFFTPIFALSRVSGWAAHVIEEQFATAAPKPALYRPGATYVGDYCGPNECSFVDIDNRKGD
ncbi:citrate synthase [Desulfocicer vacuolatum DSM 3385]|uniref:Citrate synthase n=1 Tax=Desulfocicer vacuolatum DSM 3385 TaxID=1121400 RepID=A0A1W2DGP7_9BACT|nr:citrate/2-methylcitrate synthase [Desulfocicer vacuolatum]SMC96484.1 citrate synthase [Desulfocicer vacuolatum DSM 3385]